MNTRGTVRLATRGSRLARRQARLVADRLESRRMDVEVVTVETTGDQLRDELIHQLGTTGAFVRELDEQVLDGTVDAAVHSLKDVPTEQPPALVTAAVPERSSPGDVLVTPDGRPLADLPREARVGTASLRRGAQLRRAREDLEVVPIRGNVDTRLEKLLGPWLADEQAETDEEDWRAERSDLELAALERDHEERLDAVVLARAGLERSDLAEEVSWQPLPVEQFPPAPGQGTLAVSAREGEDLAETLHGILDHPRSRVEATVERTILAELGGGCIAPIGIHAVVRGEHVHTSVGVYSRDGTEAITAARDLPIERHPAAARDLAVELAEEGARELIETARTDGNAGRREGGS